MCTVQEALREYSPVISTWGFANVAILSRNHPSFLSGLLTIRATHSRHLERCLYKLQLNGFSRRDLTGDIVSPLMFTSPRAALAMAEVESLEMAI